VYLFSFNFSILIPLHADRTYDGSAQAIGFLFAAIGLGAFIGAIVMANRQPEPSLRRLAGFSAAFGVFLAVEGLAPTFLLALISMVPVGYVSMLFAITANSTLQQFTRADMRGRVHGPAGACVGFEPGSAYGRYCCSIRVISPPSTVNHHGALVPA
jgi:hypothetical protein